MRPIGARMPSASVRRSLPSGVERHDGRRPLHGRVARVAGRGDAEHDPPVGGEREPVVLADACGERDDGARRGELRPVEPAVRVDALVGRDVERIVEPEEPEWRVERRDHLDRRDWRRDAGMRYTPSSPVSVYAAVAAQHATLRVGRQRGDVLEPGRVRRTRCRPVGPRSPAPMLTRSDEVADGRGGRAGQLALVEPAQLAANTTTATRAAMRRTIVTRLLRVGLNGATPGRGEPGSHAVQRVRARGRGPAGTGSHVRAVARFCRARGRGSVRVRCGRLRRIGRRRRARRRGRRRAVGGVRGSAAATDERGGGDCQHRNSWVVASWVPPLVAGGGPTQASAR